MREREGEDRLLRKKLHKSLSKSHPLYFSLSLKKTTITFYSIAKAFWVGLGVSTVYIRYIKRGKGENNNNNKELSSRE